MLPHGHEERGEGVSGQPQQQDSRLEMQAGDGDGRAGSVAAPVGNRGHSSCGTDQRRKRRVCV